MQMYINTSYANIKDADALRTIQPAFGNCARNMHKYAERLTGLAYKGNFSGVSDLVDPWRGHLPSA
jgi:hypothetical protein